MKRIIVGKAGKRSILFDLAVLMKTRLLITANSGGGKSYLLRLLAELLFPYVQVIIIDPEGEFESLREKFPFILVGKRGETPADVRCAQLVAHRLLELKTSAICDIYELKPPQRHTWVKLFIEALIDAPKHLWRPVVVIVDEAHVYCPEKGQGESEAYGAMVDLATRGRKRGLCAIYATQRLSKLSKNATAEMLNRLVGPTFEDIDLDRAADLLSVPRAEKEEFKREMKTIDPGNFYALGRAISKERVLFEVGKVKTTHPEPGSEDYSAAPPPTPEKVKALLPKLADLPREAETKAKTEAELRAEIRSLKAQIAAKPKEVVTVSKAVPVTKTEIRKVEVPVVKEADLKRVEKSLKRAEKLLERLGEFGRPVEEATKTLRGSLGDLRMTAAVPKIHMPIKMTRIPVKPRTAPKPVETLVGEEETSLVAGERKMLGILAQFHPGNRTRSQIAQLSGYTASGGTFGGYFGKLRRLGYILEQGDKVTITQLGLDYFGGQVPETPGSTEELVSLWKDKLIAGERKMLDAVLSCYPEGITKEELGEKAGYESSGGTFGGYLGTLRRNDLIVIDGDVIKASESFFQFA